MKRLLIASAVLTSLWNSSAIACDPDAFCNGLLSIQSGWVMVGDESYCRLKPNTYGAKEILKKCRVGAICHAEIVGDDDACYVTRDLNKVPFSSRVTHKNPKL